MCGGFPFSMRDFFWRGGGGGVWVWMDVGVKWGVCRYLHMATLSRARSVSLSLSRSHSLRSGLLGLVWRSGGIMKRRRRKRRREGAAGGRWTAGATMNLVTHIHLRTYKESFTARIEEHCR